MDNNSKPKVDSFSNSKEHLSRKPINSFAQTENYLRDQYDLRYNIVANEVECKRKGGSEYNALNDSSIFRELKLKDYNISQQNLKALLRSDFIEPYNPFIHYFENLDKWSDGMPDYISQLSSYVKAVDQDRFAAQFKKMLVRTVACAINDNIYNKQAFILVGHSQNTGKSTFCRFLCPPALFNYITESFSTDKDGQIALCENFIINLDELATLSKSDINHLKSVFSRDRVKVRHPYGQKATVTHRRASFFGSTNNEEFLTDESGSVRWLCFMITGLDWNYWKEVNIDQVWAQAYNLYLSEFQYQLTSDEIKANEIANRRFQKSTPEIDLVNAFFLPGCKEDNDGFYQPKDFKDYLNQGSLNPYLKGENIGRALNSLGFERISKRPAQGFSVYGYYFKYRKIPLNRDSGASGFAEFEENPTTPTTDEGNILPF